MGVSLSKGGNVSLTKEAPGLTAVIVGLATGLIGGGVRLKVTHASSSPAIVRSVMSRALRGN